MTMKRPSLDLGGRTTRVSSEIPSQYKPLVSRRNDPGWLDISVQMDYLLFVLSGEVFSTY